MKDWKSLTYIFIFVVFLRIDKMHIDHIAIWTDNLESEKNFFLKYFDCSAKEIYINPRNQFSSYFLTFSGGARLELMKRTDVIERRGEATLGLAHFAVDTGSREEVDRITEILEKDGQKVISKPRVTGDGYYESVVLDPENNVIEIMSK
jgi:lactoylglutathione lyase